MNEPKVVVEATRQFYASGVAAFFAMAHGVHLHAGLWSPGCSLSTAHASVRFTDYVISRAAVNAGQRFLDIGCGRGGPAVSLAMARGCRVVGVNVVEHQLEASRQHALAEGVGHLVEFVPGDAHALPFSNQSFDGAWFFESISHMNVQLVLREAHRVLAPGARVLVADFPLREDALPRDIRLAQLINGLQKGTTSGEYELFARNAGFEVCGVEDLSVQVGAATWSRYVDELSERRHEYTEALGAAQVERLLQTFAKLSPVFIRTFGYALIELRRT